MAELEFRSRSYRRPTRPTESRQGSLTWKIAIGVFLGLSLFGLATCAALSMLGHAAIEEQRRIDAQHAAELRRALTNPDPFGWQAQAAKKRQEMERRRTDEALQRALKPNQRCIQGQRFQRVENGWQQLPHEPC
jgi:hypothetical protein